MTSKTQIPSVNSKITNHKFLYSAAQQQYRVKNMNSKRPSIRPLGQCSIPSTFIFRSTNMSSVCDKNADFKASNEKGSRVSLSEFLNRKLHRSSVLPGLAKGKERSFLSPEGCENVSSAKGEKGKKERVEGEKDIALDVVLQQFRTPRTEKENACSFDNNEAGSSTIDETNESRKRKRGDHVECSKKLLAVLGDDSDIKKRGKRKSLASNERPKHLFNHYANGGGWWDCNMEGVDNEEVGCAEVWEGMGSTTLGGLDWH